MYIYLKKWILGLDGLVILIMHVTFIVGVLEYEGSVVLDFILQQYYYLFVH